MKVTDEFTVSVPVEQAWRVLTDLEGIAPCMPGAQLTGFDGETYQGKVRVKLGPVISDFSGTARFAEKDDQAYRAVIDARGKDSRGAGNASALISAGLRADGDKTVVSIDTDLKISGKVAQFGSGMIKQVSEKLLGQFVDCLEAKLAADDLGRTEEGPTAAPGQAASVVTPPAETSPSPATAAQGAGGGSVTNAEEPAALDLMQVAGGSVAKRLLPVLLGVVVVLAVIVYLVAR
ncbi:SRPBCC family protein [Kribbella sp. VKM Ac-2568]|uniref:SRPBCC family protein n=1 Tax=Kribbella sp. VKM Ac-2568 TaxID=2512219 RepID=UPI00104A4289|nr:SRPBCC family protein [Kribbella sp. VKM Ac-2568]TCM44869.1 carbon monoxide dehydrogenase subunit G [Kribbella sp. VKM Ac-2568]